LSLVLALSASGAFLIWRDVRRELRVVSDDPARQSCVIIRSLAGRPRRHAVAAHGAGDGAHAAVAGRQRRESFTVL
jgi:hypothetical protein